MTKKREIRWIKENLVALLALLFTIIGFAVDSCQNSELKEIRYRQNSLDYRPMLEVDTLKVNSIEGEFRSVDKDTFNNESTLTYIYNLEYEIELVNTGNTNASIVSIAWTDTITGHARLRFILKDQKATIRFNTLEHYFKDEEVAPNKKYITKVKRKLNYLDGDNTFTLHFLMLYENEFGTLYDTYHWVRYRLHQPDIMFQYSDTIRSKTGPDLDSIRIKVPKKIRISSEIISIDESNSDFEIYSEKEKNTILNALRKRRDLTP